MPVTVNTNLYSINAQKNLSRTQDDLARAMQRLSSGLRVNMAKDDAAGLALATRMDSQARGLVVAERNANDAISLLQVADNSLSSMNEVMQRMRELAVQSANGVYSDGPTGDRSLIDAEYQELKLELDRIAAQARFNGLAVLAATATYFFQVGANAGETMSITLQDRSGVGTGTFADLQTQANASAELAIIDVTQDFINEELANIGASQSRMDNLISNLRAMQEAQRAAYSRIMDADFAAETARSSRAQILQQAGVSTLAQANTFPQLALSLLQ